MKYLKFAFMTKSIKKTIYFHVGTGKTGTTFLQYRVFPKFKNIYYINRTKYKKAKTIINNTNHNKYLVSREFDQQLEREVKLFSSYFPDTIPIIVFRRHDSYIASQYRRFLKNGFRGNFQDFFDLENDLGKFKKHDLNYSHQIQLLEKYFKAKPVVLIYEKLKSNPSDFINNLSDLMDVSINLEKLNLTKKHSSYSEKQIKAIVFVGRKINLRKRRIFENGILHFLWKLYLGFIRYTILYTAKLFPDSFFGNKALISKNELEKIRNFYKDDWEKCLQYSETKN